LFFGQKNQLGGDEFLGIVGNKEELVVCLEVLVEEPKHGFPDESYE
jgi:hypothetical protein